MALNRINTLPQVALANAAASPDIPLSLGMVNRFFQLLIALNFTSGAGVPVNHEDGMAGWIQSLDLVPGGTDPIINGLSGPMLEFIARVDRGGPLTINALAATGGGAGTGALCLPLFLELPGTRNPFASLFDPRGLSDYKLRLVTRDVDQIVTVTAETFVSATLDVVEHSLAGAPPLAGISTERRFITGTRVPAGAGNVAPINLRRGGLIRRIYLIARTGVPYTGVRSDAIVGTATIQRDASDEPVRRIPWATLRDLPGIARDDVEAVGFGMIDLDPEGSLADGTMLDGAGGDSLELNLTALAAGHIEYAVEYLVQRRVG